MPFSVERFASAFFHIWALCPFMGPLHPCLSPQVEQKPHLGPLHPVPCLGPFPLSPEPSVSRALGPAPFPFERVTPTFVSHLGSVPCFGVSFSLLVATKRTITTIGISSSRTKFRGPFLFFSRPSVARALSPFLSNVSCPLSLLLLRSFCPERRKMDRRTDRREKRFSRLTEK